ncbi:hypothetical protein ACH427_04550 [Streptomyces sp. NPDC020379]|uniref:spermine/spermidine synthase domain-containing protein n=1 Tax=Streptomyces sp. NPDC020379 TaxID=3365071 RepID=UPI0037B5CEC2
MEKARLNDGRGIDIGEEPLGSKWKDREKVTWLDIYDRMKVDIPVGEVRGMKITKFEVKDPDDWTDADERREDIISPLEYVRMLRDNRAPQPGWYTRLSEGDQVWMSDTTAERQDHAEPVMVIGHTKAERVVINGLGIGMVLAAALSYDHVKHVDVVEADDRVIELLGPHYQNDPRVHIHHGDAVEQMRKWCSDARWDVGWTDIWPEITPVNLPQMKLFTDFYGERCGFHGNWSEDIVKRDVWDNRYIEKANLEYLTEADRAAFESDDEDAAWDMDDE